MPLLACGDHVSGPSGRDPDVREDSVLANAELLHHLLHVLAQCLSLATAQTFRYDLLQLGYGAFQISDLTTSYLYSALQSVWRF